MILFFWITGISLALIWLAPVIESAVYGHRVTTITDPKWAPPPGHNLPSLSAVVPARNEAAAIEPAVRSLLALDYPSLSVVVVNDRSTDSTGEILDRIAEAEIAATAKLRLIRVRELPPGWLGKTHAMWVGGRQTQSDWILFTDADCVFREDALRRAIFYAEQTCTDHLVVMPTMLTQNWGEAMMIGFLEVAGAFAVRPWKVPDPEPGAPQRIRADWDV
jgi:cellulose synthase/poly-beta-1,6-N-acetylglucosamine synthase-like glycosyltransferase